MSTDFNTNVTSVVLGEADTNLKTLNSSVVLGEADTNLKTLISSVVLGEANTNLKAVTVSVVVLNRPTTVTGAILEVMVAPAVETSVGGALLEVLVSSAALAVDDITVTGAFLEVLVAPPSGLWGSISIGIENNVSPTNKYVPLTGVHAVDVGIDGWQYDLKRLGAEAISRTLYDTFLGGHTAGLLDGTKLEDWQSGLVSGIDLSSWSSRRVFDDFTWTPVYITGEFSVFWDVRRLYSDYSFSYVIDSRTDTANGHEVSLRPNAAYETISATLFKRDNQARMMAVDKIELVDVFTGVLSGGARLVPDDGTTIVWADVEPRKKEMVVRDGRLLFNKSYTKKIGVSTTTKNAIEARWEAKGNGLSSGRLLYLNYFPTQRESLRLATISAAGVVTLWAEKGNLNFSKSTDNHFSVNHDLGIVTTGGFQAPDLTLAIVVDEFATGLTCVVDDSIFDQYPSQGLIVVEGEEIFYTEKGRSSFLSCTRGVNGTSATTHAAGSLVQDVQHGAGTTDLLYVTYEAVPRVDYEVTNHDQRTANRSRWLDLRPLVNTKSNNIVQLLSQEQNLTRITLETDSELIGGNVYGPVFFGTDTSRLLATAYDGLSNRVDDLPLSIRILSGAGTLNGLSSEFSELTNSLGEISCFYNAPFNRDDIDLRVDSVTHVGADTHVVVNSLQEALTVSDVWIFQILKHDPVLGTTGEKSEAFAIGVAAPPQGFATIDVYTPFSEKWLDGTLTLIGDDSVRRTYTIVGAELITGATEGSGTRFFVERYVDPALLTVGGNTVYLFEKDAKEWNEGLKRGAKFILYEFSDSAIHPITNTAGAYSPVHPDLISGKTLIFQNRLLPIPSATDVSNNVGDYVVVAPSTIRLEAYGRDPYSGKLILSNQIRLQLRLPNSLIGVDTSGVLPIPRGWTLVTDEVNVGSGIGGANFITINPAASGINSFSLTGAF